MDRKGIRNQKHTSDGKKRNRPPNRFEMENSVENRSTSAKKLKACHTDVIIDQSISYRILNIFTFLSAVCEHVSCKTCGGDIKFEESSTRGLGFKLGLMCANCDAKYIDSCPLIRNAYEINTRFIFAMRLLGVGLQGAEKFCAFMDLPRPVFHSFYDSVVKGVDTGNAARCNTDIMCPKHGFGGIRCLSLYEQILGWMRSHSKEEGSVHSALVMVGRNCVDI